jgi:hypothetical protein
MLAILITALSPPVLASPNCLWVPGYSPATMKWGTPVEVEVYLEISGGRSMAREGNIRHPCGPVIKQNNPPKKAGNRLYTKQDCGPLALVEEISYRPCTLQESAGIQLDTSFAGSLKAAVTQFICASSGGITSDTRYELRDSKGVKYQLGSTHLGLDPVRRKTEETCTSSLKTVRESKIWTIGENSLARITISASKPQEIYQPQPSFR